MPTGLLRDEKFIYSSVTFLIQPISNLYLKKTSHHKEWPSMSHLWYVSINLLPTLQKRQKHKGIYPSMLLSKAT